MVTMRLNEQVTVRHSGGSCEGYVDGFSLAEGGVVFEVFVPDDEPNAPKLENRSQ